MKNYFYYVLAVIVASMWGCTPQGAEYTDDFDLVITNYDKNTNFSSKHTYSISDSIIKLFTGDYNDPDGNQRPECVNPSVSAPIIARVNTNMQAYGYTKVDMSQNPDVTILLSVMQTTTVYYYYDYWYWGWYYPYYWYYPYAPVSTTVKTGTLLMQMMSNADRNSDERAPVIWTGLFNGLMDGSTSTVASRITKSIDQAFKQSPYLKH